MVQNQKRLDFIDAARGLAVLGVLLVHAGSAANLRNPELARLTAQGARGVQLFFVISAFTLLYSAQYKSKIERHFIWNFFVRRFFRIAPLFYTAMLVYLVRGGHENDYWLGAQQHVTGLQTMATIFFVNGWKNEWINSLVPGGWSVVVEMNFYLLLPIIFYKIKNLKSALSLWMLVVIMSVLINYLTMSWRSGNEAWLNGQFLFFWLPNQMPVFFSGVVFYFIYINYLENPGKQIEAVAPGLTLIGLYLVFAAAWVVDNFWLPNYIISTIGFGLMLSGLAAFPTTWLVNNFTKFMGKISYSFYLFHFLILWIAEKQMLFQNIHSDYLRLGLMYVIILAWAGAAAWLTYTLVEVPGQKLGKIIIDKIESRYEKADKAVIEAGI